MPNIRPLHIVLVGCGKMGSSMMQGWLKNNLIESATILDPHGISEELKSSDKLVHAQTAADIDMSVIDLIALAVKPQIMKVVCNDLSPHVPETTPILSIVAGQSIARITKYFKENQPVIRSMPNTPAAIGKGITAAISNHSVSHETEKAVTALLTSSGELVRLDDESQMDAVTALSGSGPAYIFHLIEVMTQSGIKLGLSEEQAIQLARQTVIGAAHLAEAQSETPASNLRENVTSPGGTTAAALEKLMDGRLQDIYDEALSAAKARSIELS